MFDTLKEKVAFISGSAKGLGAEIAKGFAKEGARVIVHYRSSKAAAEKTLAEIKKSSPDSFLVSADVTREDEVKDMFDAIYRKVDSVDILINTIGDFIYKPLTETTFGEFRDVLESNLSATFLCSQAVLPKMRQKKSGWIINFGSVGCERILLRPNTTPYYIAKTGVYMLTKMFAHAEAKHGIRINMISPGALPTSVVKPEHFPAGRGTSFNDIIDAIFFLLSDKAAYIIGANIEVAGGWTPEL